MDMGIIGMGDMGSGLTRPQPEPTASCSGHPSGFEPRCQECHQAWWRSARDELRERLRAWLRAAEPIGSIEDFRVVGGVEGTTVVEATVDVRRSRFLVNPTGVCEL
jgi:hypothetical protein